MVEQAKDLLSTRALKESMSPTPPTTSKTIERAREWLLSSYVATGIANVPIFIKADNAETEIENQLQQLK